MEKLPKLESCCCGCTLKTGTKILGWLGLICSLLVLLSTIGSFVFILTQPDAKPDDKPDADKVKVLMTMLIVLCVLIMVYSAFGVIVNFILLFGVYQEKPKLVKIYVICTAIGIVLAIISLVLLITQPGTGGQIANMLISLAFQIYFFLVVNSYYYTMPGVGTGSYA